MIDHLSYSSISTFLNCPEAWRRKYIEKEPTTSSPALVFGSAFHDTLEGFIKQEAGFNGEEPKGILDMWGSNWEAQLEKQQNVIWEYETPEAQYNEGIRILGNTEIMAEIQKIKPAVDEAGAKIERKVELRVPGVDVPVIGYIDIILEDGTPADFKTSKASWSEAKASDSLQSLFYIAALTQMGIEVNWKFAHLIFVKTKTPKFQRIEHEHEKGELFFLFEVISSVWGAITRGVFPLNPTSWLCNERWCDFHANCKGKYKG